MSSLEQIRALYGYNEWANNHILDASSELSEEELKRSQGASFDSIRGNLAHTVGAQIIWLGRWSGERSEALALLGGDPSLDDIRRSYEMSHDELRRFVESLNEQELSRTVPYRDSQGTPREIMLWKGMLTVVNHGTHHRAETAMALTSLGRSPGDLDYVFFELERA